MDWNKPVINVLSNICLCIQLPRKEHFVIQVFIFFFYKLPKDHHCLHEQAGASKIGNTMNEMDNGLI